VRILIAGGYGVFGRLLAQELLASLPVQVVIAGRDLRRATRAARALGAGAEPLALDLQDLASVASAATGCFAVVCAAGPFQGLPLGLPATVARVGVHWLDISDHPGWVLPLLADTALHRQAAAADAVVIPGLSTVPALSGALVRWARGKVASPRRARVTLFIGNRNARGTASIASALWSGWHDPVRVELPVGDRVAFRSHIPAVTRMDDRRRLAVEFRVALEWRIVQEFVSIAQYFSRRAGTAGKLRLARWLGLVAAPLGRVGSDTGCLKVEVWSASGEMVSAVLMGGEQRMAVLPCLLALEALHRGELKARGCLQPDAWLAPDAWMERLQARGLVFHSEVPRG